MRTPDPQGSLAGPATTAWLFPGQGAQQVGMGLPQLARRRDVRETFDLMSGFEIERACQGEPGYLDRTDRLQPVLYTVNYLHAFEQRDAEGPPDVMAGHSLGEVAALAAAGMLDFEEGLELVLLRGRLMHAASGGGMAAAVRLSAEVLADLVAASGVDSVDVANHNSPTETVLSGPVDDLRRLTGAVRAAGGVLIPLKVSAPFHSRYMREAAEELRAFVSQIAFRAPRTPVLSNVDASEYTPSRAADLLARQVCEPVRWRDVIDALRRRGVSRIVEVGPGQVLTKLWAANPAAHVVAGPRAEAVAVAAPVAPVVPVTPLESGALDAPANGHERATVSVLAPAGTAPGEQLGSSAFLADHGVRHAYVSGSMYRGISGTALVERMAAAGYLSFFGTGGLTGDLVEGAVAQLARTCAQRPWGINVLHQPHRPEAERALVETALRHGVSVIEASAHTAVSESLVRFRYTGARLTAGLPHLPHRLLAKVSRTEVARKFLLPPPADVVLKLRDAGLLSVEEAEVAARVPLASDVCVESDSGGHTDRGSALVLVPAVVALRDRLALDVPAVAAVRVGAAGGLGTPVGICAALALGADFVLTGSVNQCTPEAATSDVVKDLLSTLGLHDTTMAPAADLFEVDGHVQVVRKGTLFAARANRLQRVFREHRCWDDVDPSVRASIERQVLRSSFDEATAGVLRRHDGTDRGRQLAEDPKALMAAVFKTYLVRTTIAASEGRPDEVADYQVHCGPALGAFNEWVRHTPLEDWRARHVDAIADALVAGALGRDRRSQPWTAAALPASASSVSAELTG